MGMCRVTSSSHQRVEITLQIGKNFQWRRELSGFHKISLSTILSPAKIFKGTATSTLLIYLCGVHNINDLKE